MSGEIKVKDLKFYKKDFKLEAHLLNGTLIGCKNNKILCIARIVKATNSNGEKSSGIINTNGSALWIDFDNLDSWNIKATEIE